MVRAPLLAGPIGGPRAAVSQPIVISIDAMGGDYGPSIVAAGIALALERLPGGDVRFLLHGDRAQIEPELVKFPAARAASEVRQADLVIGMQDKPAQAALSAGNTGALMAISKLILRMVSAELDRPAIVASWPTLRGVTAVLDVGANVTSDAAQLVQFAIMGQAFFRAVHGASRPTVGLLNVGSEDQKGHEEVREANRLLREGGLDIEYHGFVEGDDIAKGTVDVVVTDGFSGNIALKTAEGVARFVRSLMRDTFTSGLRGKLAALIAGPALRRMLARLDPSSVNGGPFLGLNGIVVKSHGGADAKGFANAIVIAANLARSDYSTEIDRNMRRLADAISQLDAPAEPHT